MYRQDTRSCEKLTGLVPIPTARTSGAGVRAGPWPQPGAAGHVGVALRVHRAPSPEPSAPGEIGIRTVLSVHFTDEEIEAKGQGWGKGNHVVVGQDHAVSRWHGRDSGPSWPPGFFSCHWKPEGRSRTQRESDSSFVKHPEQAKLDTGEAVGGEERSGCGRLWGLAWEMDVSWGETAL